MSDEGREHAHALLEMAWKDARALTGMADPEVFADEIFLGSTHSRRLRRPLRHGVRVAASSIRSLTISVS